MKEASLDEGSNAERRSVQGTEECIGNKERWRTKDRWRIKGTQNSSQYAV